MVSIMILWCVSYLFLVRTTGRVVFLAGLHGFTEAFIQGVVLSYLALYRNRVRIPQVCR